MALHPAQGELVARLKRSSDDADAVVDVRGADGEIIARLVAINQDRAAHPAVVESLFRWRAAAMTGFLTVFEPTLEKTRGYLEKLVLVDPARILFLILDPAGRPVGNIGLCNITADEAEVDNIVRGERVETANFMAQVQAGLIAWAHRRLGVSRVYLNVLSDNERAVNSYLKAGYVETGRTPLTREPIEGGYRLVPTPGGGDPAQPQLIQMRIDLDRRPA
jgi:RimJ/RimL family protein N-acetyltransferase